MNISKVRRPKDPKAIQDCPMCRGYGSYSALNIGEYEETMQSMKCSCHKKKVTK
jgi:hypothetical protein